ncbi:hypothetical protein L596_018200 [Steinernema carpocapsae]|uniref:Uncharacterized protein n=1 Tax=Steinernema carpocapsae TaxID=34508 RepID=A0A4U5N4N5_STECR|nr:hypothetical protein L596_018200 [Steinernema carpocapsae]
MSSRFIESAFDRLRSKARALNTHNSRATLVEVRYVETMKESGPGRTVTAQIVKSRATKVIKRLRESMTAYEDEMTRILTREGSKRPVTEMSEFCQFW